MIWFFENKPSPQRGETRVIRRFALIPAYVRGKWLWLKYHQVLQEYTPVIIVTPEVPYGQDTFMWLDVEK